jgi:hypothetical protein
MRLPWDKLDVVTWSWQKVLGGEAAHGMLALSPRAVERLQSYTPPWPLPKVFRLVKKGKLDEDVFQGSTINTPSMLCVEDALDGLAWAEQGGGLDFLVARSEANLAAVAAWVERTPWVEFLAREPRTRSCTSICLKVVAYVGGLFGLARHLLGFENLMYAYRDMPELIHAIGAQWVALHTALFEHIAATTTVDAVCFWEDMAYRNGPMIGPPTFREFMSPYYTRVTDCVRALGIEVLEVDTDGNFSVLIPLFLDAGVNMFLPFKVQAGMDIRAVRQRYGKRVIIEGGLDKRVLAMDFAAIRDEVESTVPLLLRDGGYIPAIDHNVPPDVPLKNFEFFLHCVREIGAAGCRA